MSIGKALAAATAAVLMGTSQGLPRWHAAAAPAGWQQSGQTKDGAAAEILRLKSDMTGFRVLACSADGKRLAWSGITRMADGSDRATITVGEVAGRKVMRQLLAQVEKKDAVHGMFSPDGNALLVGFWEDQVLLWDLTADKPPVALENDPDKEMPWQGQPLVFSPNGKLVIGGAVRYQTADKKRVEPREIAVWDAATGKILRRFGGEWPNVDMRLIRVSGDGQTLLAQHSLLLKVEKKPGQNTSWTQYALRLWDYTTGKVRADSGKPLVIELTSSKGGSRPDVAQFPELAAVHGFGARVSPTGRFMIFPRFPSSPLDIAPVPGRTIRLSDRATGMQLHAFEDYSGQFPLPFSWASGANTLAVAGGIDKKSTLIIWDITPWSEQAQRPLPDLTAKELADLWDKFSDKDPMVAYRAMRRLAASPKQSLPVVQERCERHAKRTADLAAFVAELDDDKFGVRQKAQQALLAAGDEAIPALHKALEKPPSAEARQRVEKILAQLEDGRLPDSTTRRLLWCVELLEHLGTAEAKKLLEMLAKSDALVWVGREARASLERLGAK